MLAVGEHLWGSVDAWLLRASTGLAGGLGCSHVELCGALSGGVLILGTLYGRTTPDADDAECNRLVCSYQKRFVQAFGTSRCSELRASGYGADGQWPCATLVERAVHVFLDVLDTAQPAGGNPQ